MQMTLYKSMTMSCLLYNKQVIKISKEVKDVGMTMPKWKKQDRDEHANEKIST